LKKKIRFDDDYFRYFIKIRGWNTIALSKKLKITQQALNYKILNGRFMLRDIFNIIFNILDLLGCDFKDIFRLEDNIEEDYSDEERN
jgi:hypothetical protein